MSFKYVDTTAFCLRAKDNQQVATVIENQQVATVIVNQQDHSLSLKRNQRRPTKNSAVGLLARQIQQLTTQRRNFSSNTKFSSNAKFNSDTDFIFSTKNSEVPRHEAGCCTGNFTSEIRRDFSRVQGRLHSITADLGD
ncbi:hypothetical protein F511_36626 [Dorcoceras hygrometricum]|uniref:Uncharacterized protein n=1 Tax=Dorcoceras hygrometricum TaxID=472368 RepID=A0A2Z7C4J4_9LAMI|nr:hypothetical protein F511_36626 [Dorcoceras hygrometricum]